jgi:Tol biopolymer transport system component
MTKAVFLLSVGVAVALPGTLSTATPPQASPPATEVYLAPLTRAAGKLSVGAPINISNAPGYDNQPFFAPDGRSLYFTSARGTVSSKCGNPQTDVYRYDIATRHAARVTETADCEYSPTVMPDGRHLSVIQVEPDGTQRLWKFTIDGKNPTVVLEKLKPVGYHAWLDDEHLVLFVLGRPATLQIANVSTGTTEVVATDIGQSIVRMPGGGVSFVQQAGEGAARTLTITQVSLEKGKAVLTPLTTAVAGARQAHVAWSPDGTLLMAHDGSLHAWRKGGGGWEVVADLGALGLRDVTRLAVSPKGEWLALVAQGEK